MPCSRNCLCIFPPCFLPSFESRCSLALNRVVFHVLDDLHWVCSSVFPFGWFHGPTWCAFSLQPSLCVWNSARVSSACYLLSPDHESATGLVPDLISFLCLRISHLPGFHPLHWYLLLLTNKLPALVIYCTCAEAILYLRVKTDPDLRQPCCPASCSFFHQTPVKEVCWKTSAQSAGA